MIATLTAGSVAAVEAAPSVPHTTGTSAALSGIITADSFATPDARFKPAFRWWWQSPVPAEESVRELNAIAAAGFGEVEIAYSPGFWADDAQRTSLTAVLAEAKRLGVKVSMTLGASWPVQTPNTGADSEFVQQELQYGRADVAAGATFSGSVPQAFDDPSGSRNPTLIAVTAARVLKAGPVVAGSPAPPAESTMLDPDSLVDITSDAVDGTLHWQAPDGQQGNWIVFAFWERDSTSGVTNAFDAAAAKAATHYLDEYQIGSDNAEAVAEVGADFFEDSLELNADSLFWTGGMLASFKKRRGYDAVKYLPLFFAHGMAHYWVPNTEPTPDFELRDGNGSQMRNDYYRTLTDLYISDHLAVFQDWAEKYGLQLKSQPAYGQDLEPIRSSRELAAMGGRVEDESLNAGDRIPVNIDEATWRYALDHQRTLAGGAHQGGATRISSELGAEFQRAFEYNLNDYKQVMDKGWAAGLTQPFVHGYASQIANAPWPTQSRFTDLVSDSWNDRHFPQWPAWKQLTDYWARGALVLETGTPKTDVAIYSDGFLTTAARGVFDPSQDASAPDYVFDTTSLEQNGYSVEYLDPVGIADDGTVGDDGSLYPDGPAYRSLVVDERAIDSSAAEAIADAASKGLAVVFVGTLPSKASGFSAGEDGDGIVQAAVARTLNTGNATQVAGSADVAAGLAALSWTPRVSWSGAEVLTQLRTVGDTSYVYFYNPTSNAVTFSPSVEGAGVVSDLDLWSGDITPRAQYSTESGRTSVPMTLEPLGSQVIAVDTNAPDAGKVHVVNTVPLPVSYAADGSIAWRAEASGTVDLQLSDGRTVTVSSQFEDSRSPEEIGPWALDVTAETAAGVGQIDAGTLEGLKDWREIPALKDASGVGVYTSDFDVPESWFAQHQGATMNLGRVDGTATVTVNGHEVGRQVGSDVEWDVSDVVIPGQNTVKVKVRTTLRNAVTVTPGRPNPRTITQSVGLLGPVALSSYTEVSASGDETAVPQLTVNPARVRQGETITVRGTGFTPDEPVDVTAHSAPVTLAHAVIAKDGTLAVEWSVPDSFAPGEHRAVASDTSGVEVASAPFTVIAASGSENPPSGSENPRQGSDASRDGDLASTGSDAESWLLAALVPMATGGALVVARRMRRRRRAG